ncbi:MAG: hypothetical protein RLZZ511_4326 [Cyanobacteriota bacterium]|jgi:hypothetical protein
MITIASDKYQHNGYDIELKTTPEGIEAICTGQGSVSFLPARPTRAEALYIAMRTIDAKAIAFQIDDLVDEVVEGENQDAAVCRITELVGQLVLMISHG